METVSGDGWGQRTANCMNNFYTNRGWISVFGVVLGAFAPESVAVVSVSCAYDEYEK